MRQVVMFSLQALPEALRPVSLSWPTYKNAGNNIGFASCFYPFKAISFVAEASKLKIEKSKLKK